MPSTVFFSWQADTPTREGRNFVERALGRAVGRIGGDTTVEEAIRELTVDRDTKGVSGSPPIVETIFRKIDNAALFVPDLTFVGKRADGRLTPNPNVLIEYGWALKSLGHGRIVPVMNTAFGQPSAETMPFNLHHLRYPILYHCPADADEEKRKRTRESLARQLEEALRAVLTSEDLVNSSLDAQPRCHIEFDRCDTGCVHPDMLGDGTIGLSIRVLLVCDTTTPIVHCQGHLNGVYRRKTEQDKWEPTQIDERLSLSWGTIGFTPITLYPGLKQYLDVATINDRSEIWPYVQNLPTRSQTVFASNDYYRLDLVVTGDNRAKCALSLQVKRTSDWDKPEIRVLPVEGSPASPGLNADPAL
jgi:hypothetical protein